MEPTANQKPARRLVTFDGKTHDGAEIPEEEQTMTGTVAEKASRRAPNRATRQLAVTLGMRGREKRPQGGVGIHEAWLGKVGAAETKIRRALDKASKRYGHTCVNNRSAIREQAWRLWKTGRNFRELLSSRSAGGKEILTIGEGKNKRVSICTPQTQYTELYLATSTNTSEQGQRSGIAHRKHTLSPGLTIKGGHAEEKFSTEPRIRPNCQRACENPV